MITQRLFPSAILHELKLTAEKFADQTMPVYAEAERVRQRWQSANIALEEYVEELVRLGNQHRVSFEFNPEQAADALRGTASISFQAEPEAFDRVERVFNS
jgi:hypothetical protein